MQEPVNICWFRDDLRTKDHLALAGAAHRSLVLPIYILDEENPYPMGAASRLWLYHSLISLNKTLRENLSVYRGKTEDVFHALLRSFKVGGVYWNRSYEPWQSKQEQDLRVFLESMGIVTKAYPGSTLWEPKDMMKDNGTSYQVFTPFYKACMGAPSPRVPVEAPTSMRFVKDMKSSYLMPCASLLPSVRWDQKIMQHWAVGEGHAHLKLHHFLRERVRGYDKGRDVPGARLSSSLSPHLHFGEISVQHVWHASLSLGDDPSLISFRRQLVWREFCRYLLLHHPFLPKRCLQRKFEAFPWRSKPELLKKWQQGKTGIPFVDAGMQELWQTGTMHNRLRMVVGSFLVKNLMIDWREGQRWFWDCLLDADLANNSAGWQWIAGCGADAAPYFRIFNPVRQASTFDPKGTYIHRFVPALKRLPPPHVYAPWEAPPDVLRQAGVRLGETFPYPIVSLKTSREEALNSFHNLLSKA